MNSPIAYEQVTLSGISEADQETSHMIVRISAIAAKLVFPFVATQDIRFFLCGINIRPLEDGSAMIVATDGHRYIVARDPNAYVEKEVIVAISKDAIKHMGNPKHTLDVMSSGTAMVSGAVAEPLFIQPGNSLIEGQFPRIERVASTIGYKEGISGSVNSQYLHDALLIAKNFGGSIRFFTRGDDGPLNFVLGAVGDLECFGGIMKMKDNFNSLPAWFPKPGEIETLSDI